MFNREYALTSLSYYDSENRKHIDLSNLDNLTVIDDADSFNIVCDRRGLDIPLILKYSTASNRDYAYDIMTNLIRLNFY